MAKANKGYLRRQNRVRYKISTVSSLPRLSVFRSNVHIYAQVIDDAAGVTLAYVGTVQEAFSGLKNKANVAAARELGLKIGALAIKNGVTKVVFDKGGYAYHGRVKALAEGAREAGLKF